MNNLNFKLDIDIATTLNRDKVMSKNTTIIARVAGVTFYECPIHGDEAPLIASVPDGRFGYSDFHDIPDFMEITE